MIMMMAVVVMDVVYLFFKIRTFYGGGWCAFPIHYQVTSEWKNLLYEAEMRMQDEVSSEWSFVLPV